MLKELISGMERYISEIFIKEPLQKKIIYCSLEGGCAQGVYISGVERYIKEIFLNEPSFKAKIFTRSLIIRSGEVH